MHQRQFGTRTPFAVRLSIWTGRLVAYEFFEFLPQEGRAQRGRSLERQWTADRVRLPSSPPDVLVVRLQGPHGRVTVARGGDPLDGGLRRGDGMETGDPLPDGLLPDVGVVRRGLYCELTEDGSVHCSPRAVEPGDPEGRVDVSDAVYLLSFLFSGGSRDTPPTAASVESDSRASVVRIDGHHEHDCTARPFAARSPSTRFAPRSDVQKKLERTAVLVVW